MTRGDADWTDSLLNSGHINVDTVLVDGRTALMVAAGDGHDSVVKILLQHKAVVARDKVTMVTKIHHCGNIIF